MRGLHSTGQTEYQILDTPPTSFSEIRPFPNNLRVLKFAALSKYAKPTTLNVVGYIDQVKTRETDSGNYAARFWSLQPWAAMPSPLRTAEKEK